MTAFLDDTPLADLARRLRVSDPGRWHEADLRNLVAEFGWEWSDPVAGSLAGPRLTTGLPGAAGAGWLRPVGEFEAPYVLEGEEFVGLYLPVSWPAGDSTAKAEGFRRAAETLTRALGPAPIMGVYGDPGPFFDTSPFWGSPFLRWRGGDNSLELRAGNDGAVLLLQPNDPVENWHWRQGHGEVFALGGFFATRPDPANGGLGLPGMWSTDDWSVFGGALADFLGTLPAEAVALGVTVDLGFHARVPGTKGPVLFHLRCGERLEIVYDVRDVASDGHDPVALGWTPTTTTPAALEHWLEHSHGSGVFGPGEVDGRVLAGLVVDTARDLGVPSPRGLSLADHSQRLGSYYADYYGLTLRENP